MIVQWLIFGFSFCGFRFSIRVCSFGFVALPFYDLAPAVFLALRVHCAIFSTIDELILLVFYFFGRRAINVSNRPLRLRLGVDSVGKHVVRGWLGLRALCICSEGCAGSLHEASEAILPRSGLDQRLIRIVQAVSLRLSNLAHRTLQRGGREYTTILF